MRVQKIILVLLWLVTGNVFAQIKELPRATLIKNKIREIKTFSIDSIGHKKLVTHKFYNDSGLLIKEIHHDTNHYYSYTYDSFNRIATSYYQFDGVRQYFDTYDYIAENTRKITRLRNGKTNTYIYKDRIKERHHRKVCIGYTNGKRDSKDVWRTHKKNGKEKILWKLKTGRGGLFTLLYGTERVITINYYNMNDDIVKAIIHIRKDKYLTISECTYNRFNEYVKVCHFYNNHQVGTCEYYEYVKKTN